MICVWNRRRASDRLLKGLLMATLWLLLLPGASVAQLPGSKDPEEIRPAPGLKLNAQMEKWFAQDRTWLAGQLDPEQRIIQARLPAQDSTGLVRLKSAMMAARPDSGSVFRPLTSMVRDRWLDRGFFQVQIGTLPDTSRAVLVVDPGPRFAVALLEVKGEDFTDKERLLDLWLPHPGDPFSGESLQNGIARVLEGVGEAGYPFARWVTSAVSLDTMKAEVSLEATLLPGRQSYLGPITSDLPVGRPRQFLARASGLRPGEMFRESDLQRAVDKLVARDLYTQVGKPRVYPTTQVDTVGIHFPIIPRRKVNSLQVVLGLSRRQEESPSRLSGEVSLRLPNMAGSGRNLGLQWRDDGNGKSRFGFDFLEPLAFGTPLDMQWELDSEVQEEAFTRFRLENRWQLPVVALWGVELGVGWDRSTYPTGILESSSRTRARGAFLHRRGDRTRSGWSGSFALETAWRSGRVRSEEDEGLIAGPQLGESLTQRIYEVDVAGEVWLSRNWSVAGRASFRELDSQEEIVPLGEQFRFGGAASVRGYREDEFNGSEAAWGGLELRVGAPLGSRLYTFYDVGYFGFSTREIMLSGQERVVRKKGWPRGYGLGLLARTPGGDISLAIGFPGTVDFDVAKLHVTLLESF
jgi:outer membrane protein assembly factor BamA